MANIKITDLDAYTNPDSTDVLPIVDVDADTTKRVTIADLMENAGAGTAALPGIAFDGDPNTGIYRPAADQIALSTAGTQRLLIDDSGVVTVAGDLTVNGTTTTVNSTTVTVDDKNIELGSVGTPSDTTADGGGITLKGATDKTLNWVNSTDSWTSSEHVDLASGKEFKINGTSVLSNNTLGSGVTASSLTSVGTITTGVWNGTALTADAIGTGAITTAKVADDAINADKLANTTVTAGSYTAADITVDQQGRITAAANGTLSNAEIADGAISTSKIADDAVTAAKLADTAVTAGSYTAADITVDAQGRITAASNGSVAVTFPIDGGDNDQIRLGASQDLLIYHDGGNSFIKDAGTGNLRLQGTQLRLQNAAGTADYLAANDQGAVNISYNNNVKLATTSTGIDVTGTAVTDGVTSSARIIIGQTDTTGTDGEADDLIVANNSSNAGITVRSSSSANASLYFADQDAVRQGRIEYNHTSDYMRFNTAGSEVVRIDSGGRLRIGGTTESADGAFDDLLIGNYSGNRGISILSGGASQGALGFAKSGTTADGYIAYNHNSTATSSSMVLKSQGEIAFNAGSSQKAVITHDGKVGIGFSSPGSFNGDMDDLVVGNGSGNRGIAIYSGTTADGNILFHDAANTSISGMIRYGHSSNAMSFWTNGSNQRLTIDSSGNVGIGTTSADTPMHVSGGDGNVLTLQSTTGMGTAGQNIGITFTQSTDVEVAKIDAITESSANIGLAFSTYSSGASERVRIDSSGRLGVGTSDPGYKLTVKASSADGITIQSNSTSAGTYGQLGFLNSTNDAGAPGLGIRGYRGSDFNSGYLTFNTGGASIGERFRIGSAGQLGIAGANYGTSGQVLTSQGSGSAPQWATPAGGKILQVVQTVKTDTFTTSASGNTAITGLSVSITPSATSSKILVMYSVNYDNNKSNSGGGFRIYRNASTALGSGAAAGNRYTVSGDFGVNYNQDQSGMHRSFTYLDSPSSTSSLTYQLYVHKIDNSFTTFINRSRTDANEADDPRMASSITVMEVSA